MELKKYVTVKEAMGILGITRPGVYVVAKLYGWKTAKVGNTRLYLRADVESTPPSNKRGKRK